MVSENHKVEIEGKYTRMPFIPSMKDGQLYNFLPPCYLETLLWSLTSQKKKYRNSFRVYCAKYLPYISIWKFQNFYVWLYNKLFQVNFIACDPEYHVLRYIFLFSKKPISVACLFLSSTSWEWSSTNDSLCSWILHSHGIYREKNQTNNKYINLRSNI